MSVIHLTEDNFEAQVMKASLPVLVDFWAAWCGPCKMIAPVIDEVAAELKGKMAVGKVNVDEAQDLAGRYNVMSIPTLLIFKNGEVVAQMAGAMSKDRLLAKIREQL